MNGPKLTWNIKNADSGSARYESVIGSIIYSSSCACAGFLCWELVIVWPLFPAGGRVNFLSDIWAMRPCTLVIVCWLGAVAVATQHTRQWFINQPAAQCIQTCCLLSAWRTILEASPLVFDIHFYLYIIPQQGSIFFFHSALENRRELLEPFPTVKGWRQNGQVSSSLQCNRDKQPFVLSCTSMKNLGCCMSVACFCFFKEDNLINLIWE